MVIKDEKVIFFNSKATQFTKQLLETTDAEKLKESDFIKRKLFYLFSNKQENMDQASCVSEARKACYSLEDIVTMDQETVS